MYTILGFPGQTKTLSDIYYNRFRDYDSSLGRYIQADPIGLGGGGNPYVYAKNNPLNVTDPLGLAPRQLDPESEECRELAQKIENIRKQIQKRKLKVATNPGNLPEFLPGGKQRESVEGHREKIRDLEEILARREREYAEKCGGGNCPEGSGSSVKKAAGAAAEVGALYITYRIIRMIPSLFPPLWETIPANAVVP